MKSQADRASDFRALHEGDPFILPNPWDAGTAKVLAGLGFRALATTSAGHAFTLGRLDGGVTLDELADHVALIAAATDLPLSVDLEDGLGDPAEGIRRMAEAGAVGASIEDWGPDEGMRSLEAAVERVAAAVEAAALLDFPFTVTARCENFVRQNPDLDDTIARLQAYERAGADVVYAPFLPDVETIRAVAAAVTKPLNVLARPDMRAADVFAAGAQRISVGGWFAFTALARLVEAAEQARDAGDFSALATARHPREWLAD